MSPRSVPAATLLCRADAANGDRFKYDGMQFDQAIDADYDNARYYDPVTGRFMQQDPAGFAAGDANLYRFVGNGPTDATDPSGEVEKPPPFRSTSPPSLPTDLDGVGQTLKNRFQELEAQGVFVPADWTFDQSDIEGDDWDNSQLLFAFLSRCGSERLALWEAAKAQGTTVITDQDYDWIWRLWTFEPYEWSKAPRVSL